jgi:nitrogen fixation/metabolism regulation signal transduction histidine kinase
VFLLEKKAAKEMIESQTVYTQLLENNSLFKSILMGDIQSSFFLHRNYTPVQGQMISANSADSLERFRNQVFAVFGFSILVGIGVSIFFAKRLTKPVMQLVENSGNLSGETLRKHILIPDCVKLRALTDSLKSMHEQYLEQEEEKSRLESVEITKNLAAGIAHEIKNPINTVGLTLDYLQTNFSPEDPEQRYEFYKLSDNVRKELKRINKIVEGFLKLNHFMNRN